ncbi:MAG: endonuclease/exonuclease/phosphatase family protein [Acidobacteriota bacterium]
MRLLSYNIRRGGRDREKQIAAVIMAADPDIVVLQEATYRSVVETVAGLCDMENWDAADGVSLGFMSRISIADYRWQKPRSVRRAFLEIRPDGTELSIFGIHLTATHSNLTERVRLRELRSILDSIDQREIRPHLLVGDFNTLAPGELLELSKLPPRLRFTAWATGGRVRYKTIRTVLENGYVDGFRNLHTDPGFTFPTWDPHVRLDFIFVPEKYSAAIRFCSVFRDSGMINEASDHFPLEAEIEFGSEPSR